MRHQDAQAGYHEQIALTTRQRKERAGGRAELTALIARATLRAAHEVLQGGGVLGDRGCEDLGLRVCAQDIVLDPDPSDV